MRPRASQEDVERLRALSGIGAGAIAKIQEIAQTGQCEEHEELKAQIPPSLLTLLDLPNLGPKKIAPLLEVFKTLATSRSFRLPL